MTNTTMFRKMINDYERMAFTPNYIFGYESDGVIYFTVATSEVLPYVATLDRAGHKDEYSLRFCPNKAQKNYLKTLNCTPLCSKEYLEKLFKDSKYNRGELFEKLLSEEHGIAWTKDKVPFTVAGDIEINGIAYQIKFQKATFTTESTLHNLMSANAK